MKTQNVENAKKTTNTGLVHMTKYSAGLFLMTAFGLSTNWASGLAPFLHRPAAA